MPRTTKNNNHRCPYVECAASEDNTIAVAQSVFLVIAYLTLISSNEHFTPSSVILYVVPQMIDVFCCKTYTTNFKILKALLITYGIVITAISFLAMNGVLTDNDGIYIYSLNAVIFSGFRINKKYIAISLLFVIAMPFISHMSRPEKNDEAIVGKYKKKQEGVLI